MAVLESPSQEGHKSDDLIAKIAELQSMNEHLRQKIESMSISSAPITRVPSISQTKVDAEIPDAIFYPMPHATRQNVTNDVLERVRSREIDSAGPDRKSEPLVHDGFFFAPDLEEKSLSDPLHINIIGEVAEMRKETKRARHKRLVVGLVPTMGALHAGHLSLIRRAAKTCDIVTVSIFLNPTQFAAAEDYETYPVNLEADMDALNQMNQELESSRARGRVRTVFFPKVKDLYPDADENMSMEKASWVVLHPGVTHILEGADRPNFFRGVTTICMRLFHIVQPDIAFFGQKDIQQLMILEKMVRDFHVPLEIVRVATERTKSGLALSSRNVYMGTRRIRVAHVLIEALRAAQSEILISQSTDREKIIGAAEKIMTSRLAEQTKLPPSRRARFAVAYLSLVRFDNIQEVDTVERGHVYVLSGAIIMLPLEETQQGETLGFGGDKREVRLLDNIIIDELA